jgi:hypothetical protein
MTCGQRISVVGLQLSTPPLVQHLRGVPVQEHVYRQFEESAASALGALARARAKRAKVKPVQRILRMGELLSGSGLPDP